MPVDIYKKYLTVDKLPKKVTTNTDGLICENEPEMNDKFRDIINSNLFSNHTVFEDAVELNGGNFDGQFKYIGEFSEALDGKRPAVNNNRAAENPLIRSDKKMYKVSFKLDNIGKEKNNNNYAIVGFRVLFYIADKYGSAEVDDKVTLKFLNRTVKLKGNRKYYQVGFDETEMVYIEKVLKNTMTFEFHTRDPSTYPISIYGFDVFGKKKELIRDYQKAEDKILKMVTEEQEKEASSGINDVVLEMMQSDNLPLLVNWKDKFASLQDLLSNVKDKTERDDKRMLFNLSEAICYATEFMSNEQIENDLLNYIYPLIGEYICKIEESSSKDSTCSKLILDSLLRLLKQIIKQQGECENVDVNQLKFNKYNCFINYLKDCLNTHKSDLRDRGEGGRSIISSLRISQVCAFVKVAYDLALENKKALFYFIENNYPALVTDLTRLVQHIVLKEIEFKNSERKPLSESERDKYKETVEGILYLIAQFHSYVSNSYVHQEGSAIPNPHTEFVVNLYRPFLYSSSDFVKKTIGSKLTKIVTYNVVYQAQQRRNEAGKKPSNVSDNETLTHLNHQLFKTSIKTIIEQAKKDEYQIEPQKNGKVKHQIHFI